MLDDVLTKQFEFVRFPKPIKKPKKTMKDYAERAKKRIYRRLVGRKKVGRGKLPSIKSLKVKADKVFSLFIRNRDGNICFIGKSDNRYKCNGSIQNGHLFKRGKMSLRYDELNCHSICSRHNYLDNYEPQHYISAFLKAYGEEAYQVLVERSKQLVKANREFFEEVIEKYEKNTKKA